MKKEYIECGRVCTAHGVRGVLKVESWCDSTKVLATRKRVYTLSEGIYTEHKVLAASPNDRFVLMSLSDVVTREAAQAMTNETLYLRREDIPIPKGSHLLADMIGLPVIDLLSGKVYGTLTDISDAARGKLYTVKTECGDVLLPDRPEFIKKIDTDAGVYITPIPGFFD